MAKRIRAVGAEVGGEEGPGLVLSRHGAKVRRVRGEHVEETLLLGQTFQAWGRLPRRSMLGGLQRPSAGQGAAASGGAAAEGA